MSEQRRHATVPLGAVDPGRSRHAGRRSAVTVAGDPVVGTAGGDAVGCGPAGESWRVDAVDGGVVAATPFAGGVAVGERSPDGAVALVDEDGTRWRYRGADDVGEATKEARFQLPFVASLASDGDRLYAVVRRYERRDGERHFESVALALGADGTPAWRYEADASPIAVETDGDRVAVAYNRCPGGHDRGLVVLDAATGEPRWSWDPGTEGGRRVGDVSLVDGAVLAASHGDYRGYRLAAGAVEWAVPLGRPETVDGETVYTYPNHVHATGEGVVFVTGNTYPEEGRETAARHPGEHTATVVRGGEPTRTVDLGGFVTCLGADGDRVAVPCAQHFRDRDPDGHGLTVLSVGRGRVDRLDTEGVVTAAAVDGDRVCAVEEPVAYHDEGVERGAYRLHLLDG